MSRFAAVRSAFGALAFLALMWGCDTPTPPPMGEACTNTCPFAFDGDCDDGGRGSDYELCRLGTDCADCGSRAGGGEPREPEQPSGTATMMVYTDVRDTGGYVDVSISGRTSRLTKYASGSLNCPTRESGLTYVVELPPGSHAVTARSQNGISWSFTRTVQAGRCYGERLFYSGARTGARVQSSVSKAPRRAAADSSVVSAWGRLPWLGARRASERCVPQTEAEARRAAS